MSKCVKIANKLVGDGYPCFIIAEIGINHNGSVAQAKKKMLEQIIKELNEFTNDESQVGYLRQLLNLNENIVSDREIEFLIDHYTQYLTEIIPNADVDSAYFKEALYMSVACHIFRTNPQAIISPTEYRVDETSEVFELAFNKFGDTWCDLAEQAVADLKKRTYKNYGIKVFDRPGARSKYHAWGPE